MKDAEKGGERERAFRNPFHQDCSRRRRLATLAPVWVDSYYFGESNIHQVVDKSVRSIIIGPSQTTTRIKFHSGDFDISLSANRLRNKKRSKGLVTSPPPSPLALLLFLLLVSETYLFRIYRS